MASVTGVPSFAGRYGYPSSTLEAVEAAKIAAATRDAAWANASAGSIPSAYNRFNEISAGYPTTFGSTAWTHTCNGLPSATCVPCNTGAAGIPSIYNRFGGFAAHTCNGIPSANCYGCNVAFNRFGGWTSPGLTHTCYGLPSATCIPCNTGAGLYSRYGGVHTCNGVPSANCFGCNVAYSRFGGANVYGPWIHTCNGLPSISCGACNAAKSWSFAGLPSSLERFAGYPWGSEFSAGHRNFENINNNLYSVAFRPSSSLELYTLTNPVRILDREGNRMVWLCFDLKGYKPEEITVTLNKAERAVVVDAAHEVKDGKEHHVVRKFNRKFVLPESLSKVDLTKVELKSCLNVEGLLSVEIELPKLSAEEIAKCPVTSRIISELAYNNVYPSSSVFGGRRGLNAPHFHGPNVACAGSCYENAKPVTVKTA